MKDIRNNWIFFTKRTDIGQKTIQPLWEKLSIFLALNVDKCPNIVFTSKRDIWKKHKGEAGRAFYDEKTNSIVYWLPKYEINKKFVKENIEELGDTEEYIEQNFKYAIPISDIYHEMIHHVQYVLGDWLYNDLLEASAEHATFFLTGQEINDYIEERIALWYIGRKMLKLKPWQFGIFIRDCIVDSNFYKEYFSDDPTFVKILASEFGGSVERLFTTMKQRLGRKRWYYIMMRDLRKIHFKYFIKR